MIPSPELVEWWLVDLAFQLDRDGWDQPNLMSPVHADADGKLELRATPTYIEGGSTPGMWLMPTALNMAWPRPEVRSVFDQIATPDFAGWLAVTRPGPEPPPYSPTRPPDLVIAYETRDLLFVDAGDTSHHLGHTRGLLPAYVRPGREGVARIGGLVVDALRILTIATAAAMPAGTHRMPNLADCDPKKPVATWPRLPGHTCNTTTTHAGCTVCIETGAYVPAPNAQP